MYILRILYEFHISQNWRNTVNVKRNTFLVKEYDNVKFRKLSLDDLYENVFHLLLRKEEILFEGMHIVRK